MILDINYWLFYDLVQMKSNNGIRILLTLVLFIEDLLILDLYYLFCS